MSNGACESCVDAQHLREGGDGCDLAGAQELRRIVVAGDDEGARLYLGALLEQLGFEVALVGDAAGALACVLAFEPDVLIADVSMPGMGGPELMRRARDACPELGVVLVVATTEVDLAVRAMREGAEHYLTRPVKRDALALVLQRVLERRRRPRFGNILGSSRAMQRVFDVIARVAPSKASVLLTGESGTGKELVAQAIHDSSPRASRPFVKLHCASLAETLLESELFGHERGAFTGALVRREGRFKQADGGTLFLDEIGDISPAIQVKLLRFLQERTFERVGSNETLKVDVRVIAATNRDVGVDVDSGRFRRDLYYRLNVVNIEVPPLRARPGDALELATHFLHRFSRENGKSIEGLAAEAEKRIMAYRWPGNVRELENVIERAVVLCGGNTLTARHLPEGAGTVAGRGVLIPGCTMKEIERHAILTTLEVCDAQPSRAAQMLGISLRNIQYKLQEYGITVRRRLETRRPRPAVESGKTARSYPHSPAPMTMGPLRKEDS